MNIRYFGTLADKQTMVAAAPVIIVEICIDTNSIGHRQGSEVHNDGEVHTTVHEFRPNLFSYRQQTV